MRPRLLDLFCGAGGAAVGYHRAGFGVDHLPQPNYPYEFRFGDALKAIELLLERWWAHPFDAIHASPPCQRWSSKTRDRDGHPDLIWPTRDLLEATGLPYVIENVPGSPLVDPVMLCGSAFGLGVRRHRLFESNVPLTSPGCRHSEQLKQYELYDHGKWYLSSVVHVFGTGGGKGREHWSAAMGIDWMTDTELTQAIPPAMTEHVGRQLLMHVNREGNHEGDDSTDDSDAEEVRPEMSSLR